jgi:hypothetical protein
MTVFIFFFFQVGWISFFSVEIRNWSWDLKQIPRFEEKYIYWNARGVDFTKFFCYSLRVLFACSLKSLYSTCVSCVFAYVCLQVLCEQNAKEYVIGSAFFRCLRVTYQSVYMTSTCSAACSAQVAPNQCSSGFELELVEPLLDDGYAVWPLSKTSPTTVGFTEGMLQCFFLFLFFCWIKLLGL